jgi:hypothetical protein
MAKSNRKRSTKKRPTKRRPTKRRSKHQTKSSSGKNVVILKRSTNKNKKYMVILPSGKKVHFGATGYSDYTKHKDFDRMQRYNSRHRRNENWGKSGMNTAGFWAKWILWNKPTLGGSIRNTEQRFGIKIKRSS